MLTCHPHVHLLPSFFGNEEDHETRHEKARLRSYARTKAQISLHMRSLISAFVVRCLDSITPTVAIPKITRLELTSKAEQASLSLNLGTHLRRQVFV